MWRTVLRECACRFKIPHGLLIIRCQIVAESILDLVNVYDHIQENQRKPSPYFISIFFFFSCWKV